MTTRRHFIRMGTAVGAGTLIFAGESSAYTSSVFGSVQVRQTPLLGSSILQYVDPVPTFVGKRVSESFVIARAQEFQQKILPESIYAGLRSPFQAGTYLWGYKVGNRPVSYPGFTVEA